MERNKTSKISEERAREESPLNIKIDREWNSETIVVLIAWLVAARSGLLALLPEPLRQSLLQSNKANISATSTYIISFFSLMALYFLCFS